MDFLHRLIGAAAALLIASQSAGAQPQWYDYVYSPPGKFQSFSQIVPQVATTIWPAAVLTSPYPARVRAIAIDAALESGAATTVSVWCAWGTADANPAVIGTNGFPLSLGFDDTGPGVNQGAMNCVQTPGQTHYVNFEIY